MKTQRSLSRRAVLAAGVVSVAGVAQAGDQKLSGDRSGKPDPLKLKVTLTDGQILTLSAAEVVIDFGGSGQLVLKPEAKPFQGSDQQKDNRKGSA